jgi:hypothetical protein
MRHPAALIRQRRESGWKPLLLCVVIPAGALIRPLSFYGFKQCFDTHSYSG